MNSITIQYISPITTHIFTNTTIHLLILFFLLPNNDIMVHKIIIHNMKNVNEIIRGYIINKSLHTSNILNIRLFNIDTLDNTISLLAYGNINLENYEYENKSVTYLFLYKNSHKIQYTNNLVFFFDVFNIFNCIPPTDHLILLFFTLTKKDIIINSFPDHIQYNNFIKQNVVLYSRYIDNFIVKTDMELSHDCDIDNNYLKNEDILKYGAIIAPCEGMYRGLTMNNTTRVYDGKSNILLKNIKYLDGMKYGYYIRSIKKDKLCVPISGYYMGIYSENNYSILKFMSNYYVSSGVNERYLAKIILGYNSQGISDSDYDEDYIRIQDSKNIEYNIIIFGMNNKKINIGVSKWYKKGEIITGNISGPIIILVNKGVTNYYDIERFYKDKVDIYIRNGDIIGEII